MTYRIKQLRMEPGDIPTTLPDGERIVAVVNVSKTMMGTGTPVFYIAALVESA